MITTKTLEQLFEQVKKIQAGELSGAQRERIEFLNGYLRGLIKSDKSEHDPNNCINSKPCFDCETLK